jgi:hypothetical protein
MGLFRRRKTVKVPDRYGFGSSGTMELPAEPDIPHLLDGSNPDERLRLTIGYFNHPDPAVRLAAVQQGVDDDTATIALVDLLVDRPASTPSSASCSPALRSSPGTSSATAECSGRATSTRRLGAATVTRRSSSSANSCSLSVGIRLTRSERTGRPAAATGHHPPGLSPAPTLELHRDEGRTPHARRERAADPRGT